MKKFLTVLLIIVMTACCFLVGCTPTNDGDGGNGGGSNGGGSSGAGITRQEEAAIYREIAKQVLSRVGIDLESTAQPAVASGYSVTIPDKKTETTDESAIHNIKFNAKDSIGITYLLSMLYSNENYVVVNGLAVFDVTYTILNHTQTGIFPETVSSTLRIKSNLDTENDKVYFEAYVTFSANPDTFSYTIAEFGFDFDTSTVSYCRDVMAWESEYVDMMLTEDGRYLWYEPTETDEFTMAVDQAKTAFLAECDTLTKLSHSFDAEMQAYVDDLTQATTSQQPGNGGESGDNDGGINGEDHDKNDAVQGGDMTIPEEGNNSTHPSVPNFTPVNENVWNSCLALNALPYFSLQIQWNNNSIYYTVDEGCASKMVYSESVLSIHKEYMSKEGEYFYIDCTQQDHPIISTTEAEFNAVLNEAKIDFSDTFKFAEFTYDDITCQYFLAELPEQGLIDVRLGFINDKLDYISFQKNDTLYMITVSFNK